MEINSADASTVNEIMLDLLARKNRHKAIYQCLLL